MNKVDKAMDKVVRTRYKNADQRKKTAHYTLILLAVTERNLQGKTN